MAWSRKSKPKGERVVRRVQPDGSVKEYRYPKYQKIERATGDTLEALIDAYKNSPEWFAFSDATRAGRSGYLKRLNRLGHHPPRDIARRDIIEIHDTLRVEIGNGSANGFLAAARALFSWAITKDKLDHSPVDKIKAAPGDHHRAWTRAEADRAIRLLPEQYRRPVVLARHTGQRRGDLCAMTWSQYDGQTIQVTQGKSKPGEAPVRLVIPVAPALKAELDAWRATAIRHTDPTKDTILRNSHGKPWRPESLSHLLPFALARIGVGTLTRHHEGAELASDLNVHGLRKLAATELADAGCSPHEIAAITGHRTLQMVQLYTRSADQERLAASAAARLQLAYNSQTKPKKSH